MKKIRSSKKGFTLAELLIVVAIIGVLVGISIPIFTTQLAKSKLATNQANARAAYAAVNAKILDAEKTSGTATYTVSTATCGAISDATDVTASTPIKDWTTTTTMGGEALGTTVYTSWTVTIDADGEVLFSGS